MFQASPKYLIPCGASPGILKIVLNNLRYLVDKASKNRRIRLEIADMTHFFGFHNEAVSLKKIKSYFPPNLPSNIIFRSRNFHNFGGHIINYCESERSDRYKLCPYPWVLFNIAWNGDVVACCRDTEGRTILGNIFEESIIDIWRGQPYRKMRKALVDGNVKDVAAFTSCDLPYSASLRRWSYEYLVQALLAR